MPFIEEILNTIQTIICDLQPQQVMLLLYMHGKISILDINNYIM